MKTVGIIGGLGPETTSKFYLELLLLCKKKNKIQRPPILIYNVPMNYDREKDEIFNGVCADYTRELLIDAARILEKGGADFLVMPCNSLHVFIREIRKAVRTPVLSIIEETVQYLRKNDVKETGLISTLITRSRKLYEEPLSKSGVKCFLPNELKQDELNKVILNLTMNSYGASDKAVLNQVVNNFAEQGLEHTILACTDLQLLEPHHPQLKIHDTMKILAKVTVEKILN